MADQQPSASGRHVAVKPARQSAPRPSHIGRSYGPTNLAKHHLGHSEASSGGSVPPSDDAPIVYGSHHTQRQETN
jgi:hypothetical protein